MYALESFNKSFGGLFGQTPSDDEDHGGTKEEYEPTFTERFGWIYNVKQVADYERVTLDYVYDRLPLMQFMNDLVYLKEKEQEDIRILKKSYNAE